MEVANLRVGVIAQTDQRREQIEQLLEFVGVGVTSLERAQIAVADEAEVSPVPAIRVGTAPGHSNDVARFESLRAIRYHQLIHALGLAASASRDGANDTDETAHVPALLGQHAEAVQLRSLVLRAASMDCAVLLEGESGTGKLQVAKAIHLASSRASGPFVPLDCAAVPESLIESELFGHERGAVIGALSEKTGRLELARGGTLYIEQIERLSYPMQVKLLRALESGQFRRHGGDQLMPHNARLMVGTTEDLEQLAHSGDFREDLFYQLSVFPIQLYALRERVDDLDALVSALAAGIEKEQNLSLKFSQDVLEQLRAYPWPGNLRELESLMQRLSLQHPHDVITTASLPKKFAQNDLQSGAREERAPGTEDAHPEQVRLPVNGLDLKDYLARLERSLIEQALDDTGSVVARAADRLHIRRTTLVEKMRKYGISRT